MDGVMRSFWGGELDQNALLGKLFFMWALEILTLRTSAASFLQPFPIARAFDMNLRINLDCADLCLVLGGLFVQLLHLPARTKTF